MSARRLDDLRRGYSTDATLQNLLTVVSGQLELCARLPVFEYEAANDSHDESAAVFRALAIAEQAHVNELLVALHHHLAIKLEGTTDGRLSGDRATTNEGVSR